MFNAAAALGETAEVHNEGMVWWAVGLLTFGAILLLAIVLTAMTLWERKRHPHP